MLSDEEKILTKKLRYCEQEYEQDGYLSVGKFEAIKEAANLIEKQSKELEELKKENLEIRDWKYVIDSPIDLDKLKKLDLIKIKGKEYVSKDKIKAKIEEYDDKEMTRNLVNRSAGKTFQQAVHYEVKKVLESLLEYIEDKGE